MRWKTRTKKRLAANSSDCLPFFQCIVQTLGLSLIDGDFEPTKSELVEADVVFNSVTFAYPNREDVFSDLNLRIGGGQVTGVVGSTGSGKTTLVRMLLRFVEPDFGGIKWLDEDISKWKLKSLRKSISLVDQHMSKICLVSSLSITEESAGICSTLPPVSSRMRASILS